MKGLLLSGGKGTRLRPLTFTRAKQLIPIAGKPNLVYGIEDLVSAGISEIGVVVSPETGADVRGALDSGERFGAHLTYLLQEKPLGLAHAVLVAHGFLQDDPFVMYLGDNILQGGIAHLLELFEAKRPAAVVLLAQVANPGAFGVAILDAQGELKGLVEKPAHPPSDLALVGVYLFTEEIHAAIANLEPSARGELEITDAIQQLITQGSKVEALRVRGWWKDTGKPTDLLDANHLVLSHLLPCLRGEIDASEVTGNAVIESGAKVIRSQLRGPVYIGRNAVIEDSYIGPYTSVGDGAQVLRSQVEYSILLDGARVKDLPLMLDRSVVGQDAVVDGIQIGARKHTLQLVIGDMSRVTL